MTCNSMIQRYRKERALGFRAIDAFRNAKIRIEWYAREDDSDNPEEIGAVRLRQVPDECPDFSYLEQDIFERERDAQYERANRDGVWGLIGEYWDGEEWNIADSCFGFIGDDWRNSGYDTDIMASTLKSASELHMCPLCGHVRA